MKPVYEDGGITLYHGNCDDLLKNLAPARVDMVLTDPPYGVSHRTNYSRFTGGVTQSVRDYMPIAGDDGVFDPLPLAMRFKRCLLFGANNFAHRLPPGSWIVWDKRPKHGSKNVMSDGEVAWYSKGHGVYIYTHAWDGFVRASERGESYHPTQKPVALMRWLLERYTAPGEVVLDPFMGAGPVAVACKQLGREYIGVELEGEYVETAIRRLESTRPS